MNNPHNPGMSSPQNFDEQIQYAPPKQSVRQYNIAITKKFIKQAPITSISFCVMLTMFIITIVATYGHNPSSRIKYSVLSLSPQVLIEWGANVPVLVRKGQVFRLVTAIYLHGGLMHFLMNSFSIFALLMNVEAKSRRLVYGLAFFIGGIQGNLLNCLANQIKGNLNVVAIGASTSICAILGMFLANLYITGLQKGEQYLAQSKKKIYMMLAYLFIISMIPGIDFYGHFGSLFSGVFIEGCFHRIPSMNSGVLDSVITKIQKIRKIAIGLFALYSFGLLTFFLL